MRPRACPGHVPRVLQLGIGKIPNAVAHHLVARGISVRITLTPTCVDPVNETILTSE